MEPERESFQSNQKPLHKRPLLLSLFALYLLIGMSLTVFLFETGWPLWKELLAGALGGVAGILILHGNRLIR